MVGYEIKGYKSYPTLFHCSWMYIVIDEIGDPQKRWTWEKGCHEGLIIDYIIFPTDEDAMYTQLVYGIP